MTSYTESREAGVCVCGGGLGGAVHKRLPAKEDGWHRRKSPTESWDVYPCLSELGPAPSTSRLADIAQLLRASIGGKARLGSRGILYTRPHALLAHFGGLLYHSGLWPGSQIWTLTHSRNLCDSNRQCVPSAISVSDGMEPVPAALLIPQDP